MKQYTREDLIAELARNVRVSWKSYGTWNVESEIDCNDHCIEVIEITHNEEDEIGIMDGEKYNPQDYNEWLYCEFDPELDENDCIDNYIEEELTEKFEEYCEKVWGDSGNENNYEPYEARKARLAERLFDTIIEDDRIIVCRDGYLILTEAETEFLCNNNGWRADLYEGKLDEFAEAFEQWEE